MSMQCAYEEMRDNDSDHKDEKHGLTFSYAQQHEQDAGRT